MSKIDSEELLFRLKFRLDSASHKESEYSKFGDHSMAACHRDIGTGLVMAIGTVKQMVKEKENA